MRNPSYVHVSRTGMLYFRWPLPKHLHPVGKASTIKVSLCTRDPKEALRLARFLSYEAHIRGEHCVRSGMSYSEIRASLHQHFSALLEQQRRKIDENGPLSTYDKSILEGSYQIAVAAVAGDVPLSVVESDDKLLSRFIDKYELPVRAGTPQYEWVRTELHKSYRDYVQQALAYNANLARYEYGDVPVVSRDTGDGLPAGSTPIAGLVSTFVEQHVRSKIWGPRSEDGRKAQLALLIELLNTHTDIEKVTKADARRVVEKLKMLPKNRSKSPMFRGKTTYELLGLEHTSPMSVSTVNEYISAYSTFFGWATDQGYIPENYFSGLVLPAEKVSKSERRQPFTDDQLRLIEHAVLTGINGKPSKLSHKWASLIAMYTGARAGEVCQLHARDIRDIGGVLCFDINDEEEGKRLKTEASVRHVPVHSRLLELGLLAYVSQAHSDRMFPDYTYTAKNGYTKNLSTWFNNTLLPSLGLKTKLHVLHSLRHSMNTKLHHADVNPSIVKAITGHTDDSMSTGTYFSAGFKPEQLKTAIEKFRFDR